MNFTCSKIIIEFNIYAKYIANNRVYIGTFETANCDTF